MTGALTARQDLRQTGGSSMALIRRPARDCPKISPKPENLRQKRHSRHPASRDKHLSSGMMADFDDNALNGIVAFGTQYRRVNARLSIGRAPCLH
jgi:hypothetical protein